MAGTSSISGLASGLDTATIISSLMDIEKQPQMLLSDKKTVAQTKAVAYRAINTAFAAMQTAAEKVTAAATWASAKATSSTSSVAATAGSSAQTGSLSFTVDTLATAHSMLSGTAYASTSTATDLGATLTLSRAATATTAATSTGISLDTNSDGSVTLAEAVSAINASDTGVKASAVKTSTGFKLQLNAASTGADATFSLTSSSASTSPFSTTTQGRDAVLTVGTTSSTTTAYTVSSATNTFSDVLSGTSFTVSQTGVSATITVASDPEAVTKAVQALVDAASSTLSTIAAYTTASADDDDVDGILAGDYSMKQLKSAVLSAVTTGVGGKSTATAGLSVDRYGAITFDADAFTDAMKTDPTAVQALFQGAISAGTDNVEDTIDDTVLTDGLGARLRRLAAQTSDTVNGSLVLLANGQDDRADELTDQIAAWDLRLTQREETLTAKFTAMESALSTLSSQADWLTSQIDSLPSWSEK